MRAGSPCGPVASSASSSKPMAPWAAPEQGEEGAVAAAGGLDYEAALPHATGPSGPILDPDTGAGAARRRLPHTHAHAQLPQQEAKEETEEDRRLRRLRGDASGAEDEEAAEQDEGDGVAVLGVNAAGAKAATHLDLAGLGLGLSLPKQRLRGRNGGADFRRARAFVLRVKQRFEPNTQPPSPVLPAPPRGRMWGQDEEEELHHSAGIPAASASSACRACNGAGRRRGREERDAAHGGVNCLVGPASPSHPSVYRAFLGVLRDFVAEEAAVAAATATASASVDDEVEAEAEVEEAWARLSRRVLERVLPLFEGHPDLVQGFCYFLPECLRGEARHHAERARAAMLGLGGVTTPSSVPSTPTGDDAAAGAMHEPAPALPIPTLRRENLSETSDWGEDGEAAAGAAKRARR